MGTTTPSSVRASIGRIIALGFAGLLAACPSALFVPAAATAAPAQAHESSADVEVTQVDPADTSDDPAPGTDLGDEGDDFDPENVEPPIPGQPEGKAYPVEPDSLLKAKATPPPPGGAPFDTLAAPAPRKPISGTSTPQQGTLLGLHPAIFFVGLLAAHIFIVKSVSD